MNENSTLSEYFFQKKVFTIGLTKYTRQGISLLRSIFMLTWFTIELCSISHEKKNASNIELHALCIYLGLSIVWRTRLFKINFLISLGFRCISYEIWISKWKMAWYNSWFVHLTTLVKSNEKRTHINGSGRRKKICKRM